MKYAEMTDEQMLAWGAAESKARIADLAVRSADGLRHAQANAKARRKEIGASTGQAGDMVIRANRALRAALAREPVALIETAGSSLADPPTSRA